MTFSTKTLSIVTVVIVTTVAGGGIYFRLRPDEGLWGGAAASEP